MSGSRAATRLTVGERRAVGAGLLGILVVAAALRIGQADEQADQARQQLAAVVATPAPTVTVVADPAPVITVTPDPTDAAAAVKPLRDLIAGDRVVYTPSPGGPGVVCTWQTWDQSIATSTISCGDEPPFQTPTGYLTPVEPR